MINVEWNYLFDCVKEKITYSVEQSMYIYA